MQIALMIENTKPQTENSWSRIGCTTGKVGKPVYNLAWTPTPVQIFRSMDSGYLFERTLFKSTRYLQLFWIHAGAKVEKTKVLNALRLTLSTDQIITASTIRKFFPPHLQSVCPSMYQSIINGRLFWL